MNAPSSGERSTTPGRVYLVGAGPGDPGLLTLRGAACLRLADVVLYDYLVNPSLLDHAPPGARLECLGRHGRGRLWTQTEINARVVAEARAGQSVVRLKSGDPLVFAHAAEEIAALVAADIPYEIVPGVTAALAVGAYSGVPLTHRDVSSAVALVTGHEGDGKPGSELDFDALAQFPGTLVFYMGLTTAPIWCRRLVSAGKPSHTPVALVRRCTWPNQSQVFTTLCEVPAELQRLAWRPPVLAIVGDVVNLRWPVDWIASRPLFGQRVMITRAANQAAELRARFESLGAEVIAQPAIDIAPVADTTLLDQALDAVGSFAWLVFSSANGVRALLDRLLARGADVRCLAGVRLAAMGPGTAAALASYHLHTDLQPDDYRAESLADALADRVAGARVLLVRADRGREVLAQRLQAAGALVEQVVVYESHDVAEIDPELAARVAAGQMDWITVTSPAIARSLARLFGGALSQTRLVSISPLTSAALVELGFHPAAESREATLDGLVAAVVDHATDSGTRPAAGTIA